MLDPSVFSSSPRAPPAELEDETQAVSQMPAPDAGPPHADVLASLIPVRPSDEPGRRRVAALGLRRIDFLRGGACALNIGRAAQPRQECFPRCLQMSAAHCVVKWQACARGGGAGELLSFTLRDQSSNGSYIGGQPFRRETRHLTDGDRVALGSPEYAFTFRQYAGVPPRCALHARYELTHELGRGTYATVRHAVRRADGAHYAVKAVDCAAELRDAGRRAQLMREIEIMRKVRHAGVVRLVEDVVDEAGGMLYMVLELVEGGHLLDYIQAAGDHLDEADARDFTAQLVDALHYLHERKIVHRDLKPQNILLSADKSRVLIADFGVSKMANTASGVHTLRGTEEYLAPEVLGGRYDHRVDAYSLGIVVYNMLTGRKPFASVKNAEQYEMQARVRARRLELGVMERDEDLSVQAKDFVHRLLEEDPTRRMDMADAKRHPWLRALFPAPSDAAPVASTPTTSTSTAIAANDSGRQPDSDSAPASSSAGPSILSIITAASSGSSPPPPPPTAPPLTPADSEPERSLVRGRSSLSDRSLQDVNINVDAAGAGAGRRAKRRAASVEPEAPDGDARKRRRTGAEGVAGSSSVRAVVRKRSLRLGTA